MDKKLSMDTDWTSGSKYIKSSLHQFFTVNKNNHNVVSIKKEADLQEKKRNFQALKNMKHSENSMNKEEEKINYEEASPSNIITIVSIK